MEVLSYGGGRQTAGILALIKLGQFPAPDMAIFADTGGEKQETYDHLNNWAIPFAESIGIPVYIVRYTIKGEVVSLYDYAWKYRWLPQPWQRMCTKKFKVIAITRFLKQYKNEGIREWLGISFDEGWRRRISPTPWIEHYYPLIEHGLTLNDCVNALREVGAPVPPKSSCYFCPFQRQAQWMELKRKEPELFQKAIDLEEHAREKNPIVTLNGRKPLKNYLEGDQLAWDEMLDSESGCSSGHCFV